MVRTVDPRPPLLGWALLLVVAVLMWLAAIATGQATVIGFRIDGRACHGSVCRDLPGSPKLWHGRYACQGRAADLQRLAADMPPAAFGLPQGKWTITARCVDVEGIPSA